MKYSVNRLTAAIATALMLAQAATAQDNQPPDAVTSDANGNTAMGSSALLDFATGNNNTAAGQSALQAFQTGADNTALGAESLGYAVSIHDNTAVGYRALYGNTFGGGEGSQNTAVGSYALANFQDGENNTATGFQALVQNTSGNSNTSTGTSSLGTNTSGSNNVANGFNALLANSTGGNNSAFGTASLQHNTTASNNAALGFAALYDNTTGANNTALGQDALYSNTTGSSNIAVGSSAGKNITTGTNNIDIGASPSGNESDRIRIGTDNVHKYAYIMGISTQKVTGAAVYVTSTGQLGVLASSERYKTAIEPIIDTGLAKLQRLRPVSFHLKSDPHGDLQYGLIAEEVASVYPELVIRDSAGAIQGVRYEELTPLLLKDTQDLRATVRRQDAAINQQTTEIEQLATRFAGLEQRNNEMQAKLDALDHASRVAVNSVQ
jgi:hypothetical protein